MHWGPTAKRFRAKLLAQGTGGDDIARWRADPIAFVRDCLRAPDGSPILVWPQMVTLLVALVEHIRVACRAGRKVSKTYAAAILAIWWAVTRPQGRVIITGPTYRTVQSELWRDIRELHRNARIVLPRCSPMAESGIHWDDGREIRGFTVDKPEAASGTSGAEQLYIVDEASGMPQAILETVMGNLMGGGSILLISNPTQPVGFFREVFSQRDKHAGWLPLHISALESPNVVAGKMLVPGLTTLEAVEEMRLKWGETSDLYRVHVLGQFPGQGERSIIGLDLLMEAVAAFLEPDEPGPQELQLGVDVAREGDDDSVVAVRRGKRILPFQHDDCNGVVHGQHSEEVAGLAVHLAQKYRVVHDEPVIAVDGTGGWGCGVIDILEKVEGVRVVGVNSSCTADDEEHYHNLRTQLCFGGRDFLREGGKIPDDAELQADLAAAEYSFDARGRFVAEPKESIKKRLKRSPDRGDAFNLACYSGCGHEEAAAVEIPRDAMYRFGASRGRGFG